MSFLELLFEEPVSNKGPELSKFSPNSRVVGFKSSDFFGVRSLGDAFGEIPGKTGGRAFGTLACIGDLNKVPPGL